MGEGKMVDSTGNQLELSAQNLEGLLQRYKDGEDMAVELALFLVRLAVNGFECIVLTRDKSVTDPSLCCAEDENGDRYVVAFSSLEKFQACDSLYPIITTIKDLIHFINENKKVNGIFMNWKSNESVILDRKFLWILHLAIEQYDLNEKKNTEIVD